MQLSEGLSNYGAVRKCLSTKDFNLKSQQTTQPMEVVIFFFSFKICTINVYGLQST